MLRLIQDCARGRWLLVDESASIVQPIIIGRYNTKVEAINALNNKQEG